MYPPRNKISRLGLALLALLLFTSVKGQKLVDFQTIIKGKNKTHIGCSIVQLANKDYILAGAVNIFANPDVEVVRTDSLGKVIWAKTYGGTGYDGYNSYASNGLYNYGSVNMLVAPDSNLVLLSNTGSYGSGSCSFYFLKIKQDGTLIWTRTYGHKNIDAGFGLALAQDGGYILAGKTQKGNAYNTLVIKTNDTGGVVWAKKYKSYSYSSATSIVSSRKGGYIILSSSYTPGKTSPYAKNLLLRIDINGNLKWYSKYCGNSNEYPQTVFQLKDNTIYAYGTTYSNYNVTGKYLTEGLTKLDSGGSVLWSKQYGIKYYGYTGNMVYDSVYNHFNLISFAYDSSSSAKYWGLFGLKIDTAGKTKHFKAYTAGQYLQMGNGQCVIPRPGGGAAFLTNTWSLSNDIYFLKVDSAGNTNSCTLPSSSGSSYTFSPSTYLDTFSVVADTPYVSSGCTLASITLTDTSICPPFVANFRYNQPCAGAATQFYDSTYQYPTSWKWDFGDASSGKNTDSIKNPAHKYASAGTYKVKLLVSNGSQKDSVTKTIVVKSGPGQLSAHDTTVCLGDSAKIYVSGGSSYLWNNRLFVNDSTVATTYAHTYQTTAFVSKVGNGTGCYTYDTFTVKIDTSASKCGKPSKISGVINTYTPVLSYDTCKAAITVSGGTSYKTGQKLLIIEMYGATIDSDNTSSFGSILKIGNAGNYEYITIDSIAGTTLYLKNKLLNSYSFTNGAVQVVSVPQYGDVIINGTLKASAWDGKKGGVIVFEASGSIVVANNIDATGTGYRGYTPNYNTGSCHSNNYYYSSIGSGGNLKGEGIAIYSKNYPSGRGANANGGGGGNDIDAGGGGGGNYGAGGVGGKEWNSTCTSPIANGGIGGISLSSYESSRIFMGGAGGSGSNYSDFATAGATGGGIVIIKAKNVFGAGASVLSNGNDQTTTSIYDAGGGGGAGGSIALNADHYYGSVTVSAHGGYGGSTNKSGTCIGPGGGGGGGTVYYGSVNPGAHTSTVLTGGQPGLDLASGTACYKTSYGADTGKVGGIINGFSVPANTVLNKRIRVLMATKYKKICAGDSVQLSAGNAVKYLWTPSATLSDSTSSSPWAKPLTKTTYTVYGYDSKGCITSDTVTIAVDTGTCFKGTKISGVINKYASVSVYDTCSNSVSVDTSSFFKAGDKAFLVQMKGAVIDTSNSSSFGSVTSLGNAGNYEYVTVDSVGGNKVYFRYKLLNTYDAAGLMQLITVPQYTGNVMVSKTLLCQPWNGKKGGVIIFESSGPLYMSAGIDASGKGFLGGATASLGNNCHLANYSYSTALGVSANKGEGIYTGKTSLGSGRGAYANGGGGGNASVSGGGGGSNYNTGGSGGKESSTCSSPIVNGGIGGIALSSYLGSKRLFLGGGGGAGYFYNSGGTPGKNGGGMIFIKASAIYSGGNAIMSNGQAQTTAGGASGAGGGGAGGSVFLDIAGYSQKLTVQVTGGKGGNVNNVNCTGPGGGGGGGVVAITQSAMPSNLGYTAVPGTFGVNTNASSSCYNTAYGADSGRTGGLVRSFNGIQAGSVSYKRVRVRATVTYKKICLGDSVQLGAASAVKYRWSPGGSLSDSSLVNPYAFPVAKTTYTVTGYTAAGCPSTDTVTINVDTTSNCFKGKRIGGYINNYAAVSAFDTCTYGLTVDKTSYFKAGDKALLIQMKGALIDTSNASSFGAISKINSAGAYEYVTIDSIGGSTIYLKYKTVNTYDATAGLQLVTVPQYTDVLVTSPLKAAGWNGSKGGVLIFEATGKIYLLANIDVTGRGFSGGAMAKNTYSCGSTNYYYGSSSGLGALKGEGITVTSANWNRGRGPAANGGGGGNSVDCGGGGGGNYNPGGTGGKQHVFCSTPASTWGLGGLGLSSYIKAGRIFLGGGGGAGHAYNGYGLPGDTGGGIIMIKAQSLYGNGYQIRSNGLDQLSTPTSFGDGSGGGGAGGSIFLDIANYKSSINTLASGGRGGNVDDYECVGPGGGGGGGALMSTASALSSKISFTSIGGNPGVDISTFNKSNGCYLLPYGADTGKAGGTATGISPVGQGNVPVKRPQGKVITKTTSICTGDSIQLVASGGTKYIWTPGKTLSDSTIRTPWAKPTSKTTYTVNIYSANGCLKTDTVTISTGKGPSVAAPKLTCITTTGSGSTPSVLISWTATTSDTNLTGFNIYRSLGDTNHFVKVTTIGNPKTSSYTDNTIPRTDSGIYYYRIYGLNKCPVQGKASNVLNTMVLAYKKIGDKKLVLSWNTPLTADKRRYFQVQIFSGSAYKLIDSTKNSSYTLTGCALNSKYVVSVPDSFGLCNDYSNIIDPQQIDNTPPNAPQIISSSVSANKMALTWRTSDSTDINNHYIYRSVDGGAFTKIATLSSLTPGKQYTYNDNGASIDAQNHTYTYRINADDGCGNVSAYSTAHTEVQLNGSSVALQVSLKWTKYIGFAFDTQWVERAVPSSYYSPGSGTPSGYSFTKLATLSKTDSAYTDNINSHYCNVPVYYRIVTRKKGTNILSYSDSISFTPADTSHPQTMQIQYVCMNYTRSTPGYGAPLVYYKVPSSLSRLYKYMLYSGKGKNPVLKQDLTALVSSSTPAYFAGNNSYDPYKDTISYALYVQDSCGNVSRISNVFTPTFLSGSTGEIANTIRWNKLRGATVKKYVLKAAYNDGNFKFVDSIAPTDSVYLHGNLHCNSPVSYQLLAYQADGNVSCSDTITLTPYDTIAPARVGMISASVTDSAHVAVSFFKVADADVVSYDIYRSVNSGGYTKVGTITRPSGSKVAFSDKVNTLTDTLAYKVVANDSCGNRSKTYFTHRAVQLNGKALDDSSLLRWSAYQGFTVKNYVVQTWSASSGWKDTYTGILPTTTAFVAPGSCNVLFRYRIKVIENGGNNAVAYSDSIAIKPFDTISPAKPVLKNVTVPANGSVQINWSGSSSADVINYNVYRQGSSGWVKIASLGNVTTYTDATANTAQSYCYAVQAQDSCQANVSPLTPSHCTIALSTSVKGCEKSIYLAWNKYTGWAGVSKYEIYRTVNGGTESLLTTVASSATTYRDSLLNYHNKYCYRILAYEASGSNLSYSNQSCNQTFFVDTPVVLTATKIVTSTTNGTVVVRWKSISKPHLAYNQLYYSADGVSFSLLKNNIPPTVDTFAHTGINTQTADHYYYLVTVDSCNASSEKSFTHKTMDLTVSVGQLLHKLNWTPYKGFTVKKYYVQKLFTGFKTIDSIAPSDTFTHYFPAPCNSVERYRIEAVGYQSGEVAWSDTMGRQAIDTEPSNRAIVNNATVLTGTSTRIIFRGSDSLDTYDYAIQRSVDGVWGTAGNVLFNGPGKTITYIDNAVNTQQNHICYTVLVRDSCLNTTLTDTFCVINLKGKPQNLADSLKWYGFKGYPIQSYYILTWNTTGSWDTLAVVTGKDTQYLHKPLPCNVPVTYKILAFEQGGSRTTMSDSVTLAPFDTIKPPAPTINYATVLNGSQIEVYWNKSVNKVKLYELSMKTGNGPWNVVTTLTNTLQYTVSGLNTPDSVYDFRLVAIDSCSANRSPASQLHSPVQLGGQGQNLSNLLTWKKYEGFGSVQKYYIYLWKNAWQLLDSVSGTSLSYLHTGLSCNVTRFYRIGALDNTGKFLSQSDTIGLTPFDTIKPPAPDIKYATVLNGKQIQLFWHRPVSKVKLYELSIRSGAGSWTVADTVKADTSYIFKGLNTPDSVYDFRVVAIDSCAANRSPYSQFHSPVQLGGTPLDDTVKLTWKAYEGFASVKEYYIYNYQANSWKLIDSVPGNVTVYYHKTLPCNVNQYYRIGAKDGSGSYLSQSDTIQLQPYDTIKPPAPQFNYATVLPDQSIKVGWHWNTASDVKFFEIWKTVDNGAPALLTTVTYDSIWIDKAVNPQQHSYAYHVIAIDSCSMLNRSKPSHRDTIMNLVQHSYFCIPKVQLNWNACKGLPNGPDTYEVFRSGDGVTFSQIAALTAPAVQYADTLVNYGSQYYYKIKAVDSKAGFSSFSDTIGAIPKIIPDADTAQLVYASVMKTGITDGAIYVQWKRASLTDTNARGYYIYSYDTVTGKYTLLRDENDLNVTSYLHQNINTQEKNFKYYIITYNVCELGNRSKIHRPVLLKADNRNLLIKLDWTNYLGVSVKNYSLYKSDGTASPILVSNAGLDSAYTDTNVFCHHTYTYQVQAILTNGKISFSDSVTVNAFDTTPPAPSFIYVASVAATSKTAGKIDLRFWGSYTKNRSGFDIYRRSGTGTFKKIATLASTQTDTVYWQDAANLNTEDSTYGYYIRAIDSCGNAAMPVDSHTVVHLSAKANNLYNQLDWSAYKGWKNYRFVVEKSIDGKPWFDLKNYDSTVHSYTDSNITCHIIYHYRIRAVNLVNGLLTWSNEGTDTAINTVPPDMEPLSVATVTNTGTATGKIYLTWVPSKAKNLLGYNIYRSDDPTGAVWKLVEKHYTFTTWQDSLLNTYGQPYYYRIQAVDSCGNLAQFTSTHKTMRLKATAGNQYIQLNWNAYQGWKVKRYEVYRDGKRMASFGKDTISFRDTLTICTEIYHYLVKAVCDTVADTLVSFSNTDSMRGFDHVPPQRVYLKTVTVSNPNKAATITWAPSASFDVKNYYIYRRSGLNGDLKFIDSTDQTSYTDSVSKIETVSSVGDQCYFVFAHDHCGNISPGSNRGCLIILDAQNKDGYNALKWNGYQQWNDGVQSYNVYKNEDNQGWNMIGTTTGSIHDYKDKDLGDTTINYCYQVEAVENAGQYNQLSRSTMVCVHQDATVFVPNTFSHYLIDGLNDKFGPKGLHIKNYTMQIYNRWGELIYKTEKGEEWDGTFRGQDVPEGVYVYIITIEDYNKHYNTFKGNITIFR